MTLYGINSHIYPLPLVVPLKRLIKKINKYNYFFSIEEKIPDFFSKSKNIKKIY